MTILLTLFWFCGSVVWAAGLTKLKDKTDAEEACKQFSANIAKCKGEDEANYAGLTISVVSIK